MQLLLLLLLGIIRLLGLVGLRCLGTGHVIIVVIDTESCCTIRIHGLLQGAPAATHLGNALLQAVSLWSHGQFREHVDYRILLALIIIGFRDFKYLDSLVTALLARLPLSMIVMSPL